MSALLRYFFNIWIAIDQLLNVALCNGHPDETMSSNAYRAHKAGKPWGFMKVVIDIPISLVQSDHCLKAYESERLRLQHPREFQ